MERMARELEVQQSIKKLRESAEAVQHLIQDKASLETSKEVAVKDSLERALKRAALNNVLLKAQRDSSMMSKLPKVPRLSKK